MDEHSEKNMSKPPISKLLIFVIAITFLIITAYCVFAILSLRNPNQSIFVVATESTEKWDILVSNDFSPAENDWDSQSVSNEHYDATLEFKDEKYHWDIVSKDHVFFYINTYTEPLTIFYTSIEVKLTSGTYKPAYGVVFQEQLNGDLYFFGIYGEGFFVNQYKNAEWSETIKYTKSPAILPVEVNQLGVLANKSNVVFFINDQFVGEIKSEYTDGLLGIAVSFNEAGLHNTFEFDNLIIKIP